MTMTRVGLALLALGFLVQASCGCSDDSMRLEAVDDTYETIGHVSLSVPVDGVLGNDRVLRGTPLTVSAFDATSANGGQVAVAADGSFTYDPPVGFEGTDSFGYTVTAGSMNDTAVVFIEVTDLVWFIDGSAPAGGDGRETSPFDETTDFSALVLAALGSPGPMDPEPGDYVWIAWNSGIPYDGGVVCDRNILIGNGVDLIVQGQVIRPAVARPVLTNSGIDLLSGVFNPGPGAVVRGLNVETTFGAGVSTSGDGPFLMDEVTIMGAAADGLRCGPLGIGSYSVGPNVQVMSSGADGVDVTSLDGTFDFHGSIDGAGVDCVTIFNASSTSSIRFGGGTITNTGARGIGISGADGTVDFESPVTINGVASFAGVRIGNSAGTITFDDLTVMGNIGTNQGVQLFENTGTFEFIDLDINTTGAPAGTSVAFQAGDTGNLYVGRGAGSASVSATNGLAVVLLPELGPATTTTMDMTFQSISSSGAGAQGGVVFTMAAPIIPPSSLGGTFTVEGTTTITNSFAEGFRMVGVVNADIMLRTLNINGTVGEGMRLSVDETATGTLTITGDGVAAGSGGTVQNVGQEAVRFLSEAGQTTLRYMNLTGAAGFDTVTAPGLSGAMAAEGNLTLENVTIMGDTGVDIWTPDDQTLNLTMRNVTVNTTGTAISVGPGNFAPTGHINVAMSDISSTSGTGTGILLDSAAGGSLTIAESSNISVPSAAVNGFQAHTVTFDAGMGSQVAGGTWTIGTSAAIRVQGDGVRLEAPSGDLGITTLDVFNNAGTGLYVDTKIGPTVFSLNTAGGTINTTGGAALFLDPLSIDMVLDAVAAKNCHTGPSIAAGTGVTLEGVDGRFRARRVVVDDAASHAIQVVDSPNADVRIGQAETRKVGGERVHVAASEGARIRIGRAAKPPKSFYGPLPE